MTMGFDKLFFLKDRRVKTTLCVIALIVCWGMIWILNKYTPMYADDYNYSFIMGVYPWTRLTNIKQIPLSMYNHFFVAKCGKIFTNGLAQTFLLISPETFDVINSIAFMLMILLVTYHVAGTMKRMSLKFYLFVFFILIIEVPAFGQSYLWIDGASNYLYGPSLVLLYLIPYRVKYEQMGGSCGIFKEVIMSLLMFCCGILAGWTNENTSVALVAMIIGYVLVFRFKKQKINVWNIIGLLGVMIGLGFLLLGPGEQERLESAGGAGNLFSWLKRFFLISFNFLEYMQLVFMIITVIIGYMYLKKQKISNPLIAIYGIGALASVYSMVAAPVFPDRVWSGCFLLVLIVVGLLFKNVNVNDEWVHLLVRGVSVIAAIIGLGIYANGYFAAKNIYAEYEKRIAIIEDAKADGQTSVVIPIIRGESRFVPFLPSGDITADPNYWANHSIAEYYELEGVIGND